MMPPRKPWYGRLPDTPDSRDYTFKAIAPTIPLPKSIDLRGQMPPVYDQGFIGSCTAASASAMVEQILKKDHTAKAFHPSILATYYWTRQLEGNEHWDSGATMRGVMKSIAKIGSAHSNLWPYKESKYLVAPPKKVKQDANLYKIIEYRRLNQTEQELKTCLAMGNSFIFGFWVYESFEEEEIEKTGIMPLPKPDEQIFGGHAVVCVGFDDEKQAFLIRNSWSRMWALEGHFWMPYSFVLDRNQCEDFWTANKITMPTPPKPKKKVKKKVKRVSHRLRV